MSSRITLAVRPSLASPERWSVDYWHDDRVEAAYQAALLTYASHDEATKTAANIQSALETQNIKVTSVQLDSNASRTIVKQWGVETEEEITRRFEDYLKSAFSPLQKLSGSNVFDITNWSKALKAMAGGSPHLLSLLVLGVLLFRGPFERLLNSIMPSELNLTADSVLASVPLLLLVITVRVYFKRARLSSQLDRVRKWILQAVVSYGWDRDRFRKLLTKEIGALEYASIAEFLEQANEQDANSSGKVMNETLSAEFESSLLRDDFARKVQALAGISGEPDYRPNQLAIFPYQILLSLNSIKLTMSALLQGKNFSVAPYKVFSGKLIFAAMLGLFISLLIISPALVWTTALSWQLSRVLFIVNLAASLLTILLLTWRPLFVAFKHRYLPRGLSLYECDSLNLL